MSIEEKNEWKGEIAGYQVEGHWIGLQEKEQPNRPGTFEYRMSAYDPKEPTETHFAIQVYTAEDGALGRHLPREETKSKLRNKAKARVRHAIEEEKDMSDYQENPLRVEV